MYGADSIRPFDYKAGGAPTYSAFGSLDFAGQDPDAKARKVMMAACPHGSPRLLTSTASPLKTDTATYNLWFAFFTCNDPIPGVDSAGPIESGDAAKASDQKTDAATQVGGPEIERLPASVAGYTFKSYFAWRYYAPDGTFENSDGYTITTGRWWMQDGEVCSQFDSEGAKALCTKPDYSKMTRGRSPVGSADE